MYVVRLLISMLACISDGNNKMSARIPFPILSCTQRFCPERREKGRHLRFHPVIISRGEEQKRGSKQKGFLCPILWESEEPTHPTQEGGRERPHATSDVLTFRVFISRATLPPGLSIP